MPDSKEKTDYRDRTEVNPNEDYEVQYWSKKWGITAEILRQAIKSSKSNNVKKLEDYIKNNK